MNRLVYFGILSLVSAAIGTAMWLYPEVSVRLDTTVIALSGLVILLVGLHRYLLVRGTAKQQTDVANIEERPPTPTPGASLDEQWDEYRFESIAAAVVANERGCSRNEALTLLAEGTWTDDPIAASYFAEGDPGEPSPLARLGLRVGAQGQRKARRRAVFDLAERMGIQPREER